MQLQDSSHRPEGVELGPGAAMGVTLAGLGYQVCRLLEGGAVSHVYEIADSAGRLRVAKTCADRRSLEVEARWLRRSPLSPPVVMFDAAESILVLEHVDGALLRDVAKVTSIDWGRETEFVRAVAAVDMSDSGDDVVDVVDLIGGVLMLFDEQHHELDLEALDEWFAWARSQRPSFEVVAFDVMTKNTLVTADRWWAIDPWCVLGPSVLPAVRWAVDRSRHAPPGQEFNTVVNQFACMLDGDTADIVAWLPAALLWTWCARAHEGQATAELSEETNASLTAWRHLTR